MKRKRSNPAKSASQYGAAQAVLDGLSSIMPEKVARELIDATPAKTRKKFARDLAARRRRGNQSRFEKCVTSATRPGTRSPRGVCAAAGRRKYGKKRFQAMAAAGRRRRRNQEDGELEAAKAMYRKFTGRAPARVDMVEQLRVLPSALADCGRMVELVVKRPGVRDVLTFPESSRVRVGTTGDGGQLYFVNGDQAVDLAGIPHAGKDHVDLGTAHKIVYYTSKDFHNFEPSEYSHSFGEENGIRPTLHYDVRSKRLYLTGGDYRVKREGIVN